MIVRPSYDHVTKAYRNSTSRLLIFDYDGTLAPIRANPSMATVDPALYSLIESLTADVRNDVMILSGRTRASLDTLWHNEATVLVAEHGGYYTLGSTGWNRAFTEASPWIPAAKQALTELCTEHKGSFVEEKSFSIAWDYRSLAGKISTNELGAILARIRALPFSTEFTVYEEDCQIELRTPHVNKGQFILQWIADRTFDFILAVGDGKTDEDLFKALADRAYTIRVGESTDSAAHYCLGNQADVKTIIAGMLGKSKSFY